MKVVVTGGAGFVGSHLVDRLEAEGHSVVVVDHCKRDRERFFSKRVTLHKIDIGDSDLRDLLVAEKPDALFHLAAHISVTESLIDPLSDARVNILSALNVLTSAEAAGVKRFIFASSGGAIYGDHEERPTTERMDTYPLSPYGIAKQSFEHYLDAVAQRRSMQTIILRFSNIYGPRQQQVGGYAGVLPIFLSCLLSGKPVTIFGDGSSTRDYIFVGDVVDAFLSALKTKANGIFNISTGKETSINELWDHLKNIHGSGLDPVYAPARAGEVYRSVLSPKKAQAVLRWRAKTLLEEGLRKTHDWFTYALR